MIVATIEINSNDMAALASLRRGRTLLLPAVDRDGNLVDVRVKLQEDGLR